MYILTLFDVRIYGKDGETVSPPKKNLRKVLLCLHNRPPVGSSTAGQVESKMCCPWIVSVSQCRLLSLLPESSEAAASIPLPQRDVTDETQSISLSLPLSLSLCRMCFIGMTEECVFVKQL